MAIMSNFTPGLEPPSTHFPLNRLLVCAHRACAPKQGQHGTWSSTRAYKNNVINVGVKSEAENNWITFNRKVCVIMSNQ